MQQLSLCLEQFTEKLHNKPYCTNNRYCIIFFCVLTIRCLGNGSVSTRLWNAIRSDDWAIPHVGLIRSPCCTLSEQLTCINGAGDRCTLTLDIFPGKRNILQSLARISLAGTAKRRDWRGLNESAPTGDFHAR
ncbi:hypothetical protein GHT90_18195 [Acinetobacter baumannii]|nr:hypothetical protein [Acinetobacter baumannii]RZG96425.1 hypothetical protein EXE01_15615 [Acinetobacter pittii]RZH04941.1 hypothetical protein EXE04_15555 [Acinetobacter pittii]RZH16244.1 hypothetical protein EXD97_15880 [Acinetobacter pittii]RZN77316.1 hypothetical protein EXE05_15670 [Acinetobacter pittii]